MGKIPLSPHRSRSSRPLHARLIAERCALLDTPRSIWNLCIHCLDSARVVQFSFHTAPIHQPSMSFSTYLPLLSLPYLLIGSIFLWYRVAPRSGCQSVAFKHNACPVYTLAPGHLVYNMCSELFSIWRSSFSHSLFPICTLSTSQLSYFAASLKANRLSKSKSGISSHFWPSCPITSNPSTTRIPHS